MRVLRLDPRAPARVSKYKFLSVVSAANPSHAYKLAKRLADGPMTTARAFSHCVRLISATSRVEAMRRLRVVGAIVAGIANTASD